MALAAEQFVLVILDGLGDRPHPDTGGRTPVEAAATPELDRAAGEGDLGDVVLIGPGIAPESDAGVFALLGYDPIRESPGRGVLEAEGVDLHVGVGDVAFRLNFATTDGADRVLDARVDRSLSTQEATELADALTRADLLADRGIAAEVRATVGHRGVLFLHPRSGGRLSPEVSNADPFYERIGGMGRARTNAEPRIPLVRPEQRTREAERTAAATNEFLTRAAGVLASHPANARRALGGKKVANGLLVRNAGTLPSPPPRPWAELWGVRGAAVTEMPVERGIARLLGLRDEYVGPMGVDREGGYRERAERTARALERSSFVYVHLKGPDEPGHDGDARRKQEVIEAIDRSFFGPLLRAIDRRRVRVAITADHATPTILRGHSDDPVPLLLLGADVPSSGSGSSVTFGEPAAACGRLGHLRGRDVMPLLLERRAFEPA
ncbi:MAG: alkaline phosphatase family protein [Thermoplasmata archaeon]